MKIPIWVEYDKESNAGSIIIKKSIVFHHTQNADDNILLDWDRGAFVSMIEILDMESVIKNNRRPEARK